MCDVYYNIHIFDNYFMKYLPVIQTNIIQLYKATLLKRIRSSSLPNIRIK